MAALGIKAVIFDCFGVLYTDSKQSLLEIVPDDKRQELQDIFTSNNYGYLGREEYLRSVSETTHLELDEVQDYFASEHHLNTALITYLRSELKSRYKIGLLSNIGHDWIQSFFSEHELHDLFDVVVLSGDEGIAKPHPHIFEIMASRLGLEPAECLMIDDLAENCEGAEIAGLHAIQYTSNEQVITDVKRLLT